MIILTALMFVSGSLLLMTSCGGKQTEQAEETTPVPVEQPTKPPEAVKAPQEQPTMTTETTTRTTTPSAPTQVMKVEEKDEGTTPLPPDVKPVEKEEVQKMLEPFLNEKIYFEFDKAELKPESRVILARMAEWLSKNTEYFLRIEGHCDERGTNEYNLALGERRARAAEKFINALGISAIRTTSLSYGEERPIDPGHDDYAWAENRRDEFTLLK
jgi:peptidoglycan-associated lipoprotein